MNLGYEYGTLDKIFSSFQQQYLNKLLVIITVQRFAFSGVYITLHIMLHNTLHSLLMYKGIFYPLAQVGCVSCFPIRQENVTLLKLPTTTYDKGEQQKRKELARGWRDYLEDAYHKTQDTPLRQAIIILFLHVL